MFSNNPYVQSPKNLVKLPSVSDIIKDGIETVKHTEWKEDQTPLFWSLSHILSELPLIGDKIIQNKGYVNITHTNLFVSPTGEIPRIGIPDYLVRLVKFSPCSKECFIMIIVYIDRLIAKSNFIVNSFNIHRLLITAIMVASKYIDGVSRDELNKLEMDFLTLLEFDVSCPLNEYLDYFGLLDTFVNHIRQQRQKQQMMMINNQPFHYSCSTAAPSISTSSNNGSSKSSSLLISRSNNNKNQMPTSTYNTIVHHHHPQNTNTNVTVNQHNNHHYQSTSSTSNINNLINNNSNSIELPTNVVPPTTNSIISTRRKSLRDQQPIFQFPNGVPTCIS
ncbi:Non-receptor tyrosine kinase [Heterostelium album PN500]|uniref:Non-receptor tyrosine kinase n=1 Tax=Heterostelium pallidum (strain ATCC 26659 / Pp 5 / PN500) TaxID=670386 RepID=D3BNT6_HETP5|nr:Non-receptor tyrosine kinase [Heterostelium album PN500]EFA76855.1 Non-receptor tyrosine kinase [Heterostelium album PN500]|eukprot:XP_020428987.1 Non-receptor tyrosine kinase [Heterostelium album PN500]